MRAGRKNRAKVGPLSRILRSRHSHVPVQRNQERLTAAAFGASALRDFRRPRLWLGLWIAALVATVVVCLVPLPRSPLPVDHLDKLEHALGYAALAVGAAMLFATGSARMLVSLGLIVLGIGIEALQALLPWRSADLLDVVANSLGVLIGASSAATPMANWLQRFDRAWR